MYPRQIEAYDLQPPRPDIEKALSLLQKGLNVLIDRRGRVEVYIPACDQSQQTTR